MLNQVVIIGRIQKIMEYENDKVILKLKVESNSNSELFDVNLQKNIAKTLSETCSENDIVGIKGKLECIDGKMMIHADKVTFLTQKKEKDEIER